MNRPFRIFMCVGPDQRKKWFNLGKDKDLILDRKQTSQGPIFHVFSVTVAFWVDIYFEINDFYVVSQKKRWLQMQIIFWTQKNSQMFGGGHVHNKTDATNLTCITW